MAEAEAVHAVGTKAAGKGMGALTQKVGPLPLYAWAAAFIVIWWYFQKKNTKASATGAANQQTDPAGNIGSIDPATGYVYGTPEDQAALAANNSGASGTPSSGTTGTGGSTVGGQYPDNQSWGRAAINYLVGIGVDPTTANEAIQQYLASQQLTTAQQGDVNLAIQALGAPPTPPGPSGVPPAPVVTPPSGSPPPGGNTGGGNPKVMASNPPSGFTVTTKTGNSIGLKWNAAKNATGYTVAYGTSSGSQQNKQPVTGTSTTVGNLKPNTAYYFEVWADPTKPGGPHAGPILGHTTGSSPSSGGGSKTYTVKQGDNLTEIAQKLNYPGGWQALYAKNKGVIGNNPNLIRPGEVLSL